MRVLPFILILITVSAVSYWFGKVITKDKLQSIQNEKLRYSVLHVCSDTTHYTCDGECICDGMECFVSKRDYQLELFNDTVWVYDGTRLVGRYTSNWCNQIDTILLKDNQ